MKPKKNRFRRPLGTLAARPSPAEIGHRVHWSFLREGQKLTNGFFKKPTEIFSVNLRKVLKNPIFLGSIDGSNYQHCLCFNRCVYNFLFVGLGCITSKSQIFNFNLLFWRFEWHNKSEIFSAISILLAAGFLPLKPYLWPNSATLPTNVGWDFFSFCPRKTTIWRMSMMIQSVKIRRTFFCQGKNVKSPICLTAMIGHVPLSCIDSLSILAFSHYQPTQPLWVNWNTIFPTAYFFSVQWEKKNSSTEPRKKDFFHSQSMVGIQGLMLQRILRVASSFIH